MAGSRSTAFFRADKARAAYRRADEIGPPSPRVRAFLANEDLDFVVCLGDYIYAETYHSKHDGTGVRDDKIGSASKDDTHIREAITLATIRPSKSPSRLASTSSGCTRVRSSPGSSRNAGLVGLPRAACARVKVS